jgi:protein-tyrosine-phosphatase
MTKPLTAPAVAAAAVPLAAAPKHVLFVCTGNICRSPMAEGLLRHALKGQPEPLRSLPVCSAGTDAFPGDEASRSSVLAMQAAGMDIHAHRSQSVTEELLQNSLVVFAMTTRHVEDLRYFFPKNTAPIHLMREFITPRPESLEVADPYGLGLDEYKDCRDNMVEAIPGILKFLNELLSK